MSLSEMRRGAFAESTNAERLEDILRGDRWWKCWVGWFAELDLARML